MSIWIFTYEPFEGEPTDAEMATRLEEAGITAEFVQPRTWLFSGPANLEDLDGSHSSDLMEIIGELIAEGQRGYVIAPIPSIAGKGWTGNLGAIGRMFVPDLPISQY